MNDADQMRLSVTFQGEAKFPFRVGLGVASFLHALRQFY
jgi:hypothetical protein